MYLKRKVDKSLDEWSQNNDKKPLVILGPRQCGKTTTVLEAGKRLYQKTYYINFMEEKVFSRFAKFSQYPSFDNLIEVLKNKYNEDIVLDNQTLLILDEFQEVLPFYTQLKFINENNSFKNIICLGSYLTVKIFSSQVSVPVGQIETIHMHTLSFEEFLMNINIGIYHSLQECYEKRNISELLHSIFIEYFMKYLIIGGFPAAIRAFIDNHENYNEAAKVNKSILENYEADISRFMEPKEIARARLVFIHSIDFMGRENNTFTLSTIKTNARYREYEYAILLLVQAHMVNKVDNCNNLTFPLNSMDTSNKFKIYPCDIGLIAAYYSLDSLTFASEGFQRVKGSMIESYIMSECIRNGIHPYYHTFVDNKNWYEIDLVFHDRNLKVNIVEIKSGRNTKSPSLAKIKEISNSCTCITSLTNKFDDHHIPLYMYGYMLSQQNK